MYLMCKDIVVASINVNTGMFDVYNMSLMPFALRGDNVSVFSFFEWINNRVLSISRSNAKKIINALNLSQTNRMSICFACKGLSLFDCYWLKEESSKDNWDSVNLYHNSLSSAVAKIALTGEYVSIQGKVRTPELTGGGSYAKSWRRLESGLYLYKAGSSVNNVDESKIEILCSDILDKLDVSHIKYDEAQTGLRKVSRCKNMCDEQKSICEMDEYLGYCNRNGISIESWLLQQRGYYEMLIVDYLIYNTDRHLGNWGIFYSVDTGVVLGLHPLYDHNNSLVVTGEENSLVMSGKTREQCAKFAKGKLNINVCNLVKWLNRKDVKKRFSCIFGGLAEYNALLNRVNCYSMW